MIDGVTERLATYRSGIERISTLINRRAELIVALPPLRDKFDAAVADSPIPISRRRCFRPEPDRLGLLARNPSAAEQAAQSMRTMTISDPKLRTAVDDYATRSSRYRSGSVRSPRSTRRCSAPRAG